MPVAWYPCRAKTRADVSTMAWRRARQLGLRRASPFGSATTRVVGDISVPSIAADASRQRRRGPPWCQPTRTPPRSAGLPTAEASFRLGTRIRERRGGSPEPLVVPRRQPALPPEVPLPSPPPAPRVDSLTRGRTRGGLRLVRR